jgi:peptidoglycan/LPS O-acetylase OafA/YrhL
VLQPGYLGVDIFFVLSGFLITRILLDEKSHATPVAGFLIRRIARIFPAYYLLLLIVGIVAPATSGLWLSAVYLSNYYFAFDSQLSPLRHTWSLAVEEHFYLLWPWMVCSLSVRASRAIIVYLILPAAIALAVLTAYLEPTLGYEADALVYRMTWYRMLSLGAGALLAYHETDLRAAPRTLLLWAASLGICGATLLPTAVFVDHRWIGPIMLVGFSSVSVATVMITLWLQWSGSRWDALMRHQSLAFVGRISYGLYLYHFPIFVAFGIIHGADETEASWLRCAAAVSVSLGVAWLSFTYFEKPIQEIVRRRLKTRNKVLAPSSAIEGRLAHAGRVLGDRYHATTIETDKNLHREVAESDETYALREPGPTGPISTSKTIP